MMAAVAMAAVVVAVAAVAVATRQLPSLLLTGSTRTTAAAVDDAIDEELKR